MRRVFYLYRTKTKDMKRVVKFVDAFRVNNAPYDMQETHTGRLVKVYLPEAYTSEYMIKSDDTGKLCRWLVELEDGCQISRYQHFGCRPSKQPWRDICKMLEKMTRGERRLFYTSFEIPEFDDMQEFARWCEGQMCVGGTHPELVALAMNPWFSESLGDLGIEAREMARIRAQRA